MTDSEHTSLWVPRIAFVMLSIATAVPSQVVEQADRIDQTGKTKRKIQIAAHSQLLGVDVNNGLVGEKHEAYGKVVDLALDSRTGRIDHVILLRGGPLAGQRKARVQWSSLRWNSKKSCFVLGMKSAIVDIEPVKELAEPGKTAEASTQRGKKAAAAKKGATKAIAGMLGESNEQSPWIHASRLTKHGIKSGKEIIGNMTGLFVELASGKVVFVAMASKASSGARATLVPWGALRIVQPRGKQGLQLHVSKTRKELAKAPCLGDKGADVADAEFRHKVYAFYGVTPPSFDPKPKRASGSR